MQRAKYNEVWTTENRDFAYLSKVQGMRKRFLEAKVH